MWENMAGLLYGWYKIGKYSSCTQVEKDLGLIVDQRFSGSNQCAVTVKKGQQDARMHSQEYRV